MMDKYYELLFWGVSIALALCTLASLVYIIRSRLTVDRIIGINLVATIVVDLIAMLIYLLGEDYLADVALVFVILSFIAVVILCRIYINLYHQRGDGERK